MSAISIPTRPLATILRPQPRKQGFTIIEIVLVLVLLGI
ncbi:type II secretion system protein, partial [Sutterella sp.]